MALNVLFDFDSMVYKSVYKIVDIQTIKNWFYAGKTKDWMRQEITESSINRLTNMSHNIYELIEETGIEVGEVEYYITACKNSIRRQIYPEYKAGRKPNKWVNKVRAYLLDKGFAITHDQLEADDLIFDRANELGESKCLILTIDKDLKQIPGIHFNYYKPIVKDSEGNRIESNAVVGLELITKDEANYCFWLSMLVGDGIDNIKGCKGIGPVKAKKILEESQKIHYETAVKAAYKKANPEHWLLEYEKNYRLLKLGKSIL